MTLSVAEKIRLTLESLGADPDAVARTLNERGIRGRRSNGCNCPIAELLKREVLETAGQWGPHGYWVTTFHVDFPDGTQSPVPDPVGDFVEMFDAGRYPHLDSEVKA